MSNSTNDKDKNEDLPSALEDGTEGDSGVEELEGIIGDIDEIPEDVKKQVKRLVVQQSFRMMGIERISQENEISKKINAEHITNFLDSAKEQMQNDYKERHERKIFITVLMFLALAFFITIIVLLKSDKEILEKIIYSVASLVAGAFGGYGFGRHKDQDND